MLRVYTTGIGNMWDIDLMETQNVASENDGYKYVLVAIVVFSGYLWLQPLKSKSGVEAAAAFRKIFRSLPHPKK